MASNPGQTYYFCYGSNMVQSDLLRTMPTLEAFAPARACDRRLRFNRPSTTWNAGAADIPPEPGLSVWGRLFKFKGEPDWTALDRKEGAVAGAYERQPIKVEVLDGDEASVVPAITYIVPVASRPVAEIAASQAYVQAMLVGAQEGGLPIEYIRFLTWLCAEAKAHEEGTRKFRDGLLALPTVNRTGAGAGPLLILNRVNARQLTIRKHAVVRVGESPWTLARVAAEAGEPPLGTCRLDQNIRHMITHRKSETYGYHVQVEPVQRATTPWLNRLMRSRVLLLPTDGQAVQDSEKGIVVLSAKNLELLGLDPGDKVTLTALRNDTKRSAGGEHYIHRTVSLSFRAYTGSADSLKHVGRDIYPSSSVVAIDRETRGRLGVELGAPVWVRASIMHLFLGRVLYYSIAAVGVIFTLNRILDEGFGIQAPDRLGLALGLGAFATAALALLDLRHKVHA